MSCMSWHYKWQLNNIFTISINIAKIYKIQNIKMYWTNPLNGVYDRSFEWKGYGEILY